MVASRAVFLTDAGAQALAAAPTPRQPSAVAPRAAAAPRAAVVHRAAVVPRAAVVHRATPQHAGAQLPTSVTANAFLPLSGALPLQAARKFGGGGGAVRGKVKGVRCDHRKGFINRI